MCKFASRCLTITHLPYAAIKIFDNTPLQLKSSDSTHDQTIKYDLHLLRLRPERQTGINCSKRKVAVAKIPNNQFWEEPDSLFLGTNQMNLLDRSKQIICDLLFNSWGFTVWCVRDSNSSKHDWTLRYWNVVERDPTINVVHVCKTRPKWRNGNVMLSQTSVGGARLRKPCDLWRISADYRLAHFSHQWDLVCQTVSTCNSHRV